MIELKNYNGKMYASAKEVYNMLGITKAFSTWIKTNIERAMLVAELDFIPLREESTGGRPSYDYLLTKSASQDLCLISGGKNAKNIRD